MPISTTSPDLAGRARRSLDPELIRRVQSARRARSAFLPAELFADAAWDMLLELFACELEEKRLSVGSLSAASGVPMTTTLRWIQTLEDRRLMCRQTDTQDRRRLWVSLSSAGSAAMRRYFASVSSAFLAL